MKIEFRLITAAVIATILISPIVARAGPRSHQLSEDAALDLLDRTLKRDRVYEKRISLDCIAYGTEETTKAYFEFVLREIHNAKCGGDPEISPFIDRYRVYRRSSKIQQSRNLLRLPITVQFAAGSLAKGSTIKSACILCNMGERNVFRLAKTRESRRTAI
jgi:hypothetical protein